MKTSKNNLEKMSFVQLEKLAETGNKKALRELESRIAEMPCPFK